MGFSRKEYWSGEGEHFLLQGDLLNPGIEPVSPVLQEDYLPPCHWRSPYTHTNFYIYIYIYIFTNVYIYIYNTHIIYKCMYICTKLCNHQQNSVLEHFHHTKKIPHAHFQSNSCIYLHSQAITTILSVPMA